MEGNIEHVYENIYNELVEYMARQNEKIQFSKDVYMRSIGHRANLIDMSTWEDLTDGDYIEVAYLELLRRFPLETDKKYWLDCPDFRVRLVETIIQSMEFTNLHIQVINNPYYLSKRAQKRRKQIYKSSYIELSQTWYYKLYMALPMTIRKSIKKMIRYYTR